MSMQPTSNAAGRDGSALRMLKLFRDRPLTVYVHRYQFTVVRKNS
ncbi:MAG: hypothetical protein V1736_10045 [Pseudomonadota bacterium]